MFDSLDEMEKIEKKLREMSGKGSLFGNSEAIRLKNRYDELRADFLQYMPRTPEEFVKLIKDIRDFYNDERANALDNQRVYEIMPLEKKVMELAEKLAETSKCPEAEKKLKQILKIIEPYRP